MIMVQKINTGDADPQLSHPLRKFCSPNMFGDKTNKTLQGSIVSLLITIKKEVRFKAPQNEIYKIGAISESTDFL